MKEKLASCILFRDQRPVAAWAMLDHLLKLGVDAVELLSVHALPDDGLPVDRGMRKYWGCNTIGFFTPELRYFSPDGLIGFRNMLNGYMMPGSVLFSTLITTIPLKEIIADQPFARGVGQCILLSSDRRSATQLRK